MSAELIRAINRQMLELDRLNGAILLSVDVVRALQATMETYEGSIEKQALIHEFCNLHDLFMGCRPRMAQVLLDTQKTLLHISEQDNPSVEGVKDLLEQNIEDKREVADKIVELTSTLLGPEKTLFVHSYSTHLDKTLDHLAELDQKPKIIVAEQEDVKTLKVLKGLNKNAYEYNVVSEYSASHILEKVDVAMFGALTLNHHQQIIMAPGSSGLVSDLFRASIPIYILLPTEKFSYWEDDHELTYKETRHKDKYNLTYQKEIFSHDILPLKLFAGVITEEGIMNGSEAMVLFSKLQEEFISTERQIKQMKAKFKQAAEAASH